MRRELVNDDNNKLIMSSQTAVGPQKTYQSLYNWQLSICGAFSHNDDPWQKMHISGMFIIKQKKANWFRFFASSSKWHVKRDILDYISDKDATPNVGENTIGHYERLLW